MKRVAIKGYVAGILTMLLFSGTVLMANPETRQLLFGVRVSVDGAVIDFEDDMRPFIIEGRTFLPVRAIADIAGLGVDFDAATNTVLLTSGGTVVQPTPAPTPAPATPRPVAFFENYAHFQHGGHSPNFGTVHMLGNAYANSLRSGGVNSGGFREGWRDYNLSGNRTTLTGTIGRADSGGTQTGTVVFIGDGVQIASFTIAANDIFPRNIEVDVTGVRVLRIQIGGGSARATVLTNVMIQ